MIKSDPTSDLIYINEDTFWSGGPLSRINPNAKESVSRVQQLLLQGDTAQATLEANLGMSGTPSSMREYMPGGDFQIIFQNQTGSAKNYERWLDLEEGVAGLYYTRGDVTYRREYLTSSPAGVMAIRLTASQPGSLSFYIKFQRPANQQNRFAEEAYSENGDTIVTKIKEGELEAFFLARVHNVGGSKRQIGDQIQVVNADEAWIYADMETSFSHDDPKNEAKKKLDGAVSSKYFEIRENHVKDYQALFGRSSISLGESSAAQKALQTGARRQALANAYDPELLTLYYQFGRYLLISSSRPGTMAANLQGIWNNARDPAWGSKYTININIEMNYWPAEVTSMLSSSNGSFANWKTY
jgi:alpha-L-fucosidase 2